MTERFIVVTAHTYKHGEFIGVKAVKDSVIDYDAVLTFRDYEHKNKVGDVIYVSWEKEEPNDCE